MSIYSRVHLGEPKLIEAHHNGLFISYWTDRRTPSLSLSLSFSLSLIRLSSLPHSAADMKREVESGWYRTPSDCGGLKVILCAFKMDSKSRFLGPHRLAVVLPRTHTLSYIHTDQHEPRCTSKLPDCLGFASLSFSISNCPFFPRFSFSD